MVLQLRNLLRDVWAKQAKGTDPKWKGEVDHVAEGYRNAFDLDQDA